ncbi:MAG: TonB-dependent receptor [Muribaculaceae bacterium]|nr:TonB-dependent receptor [Muribaculaceae bacterium]
MPKVTQQIRLLLLIATISLQSLWAMGASFTVTGTVKDQSGDALYGVSVIAEKSKVGVATDADGRFTITMPGAGTLTFSYVGMETRKVRVTESTNLDIVMEDNSQVLDDVVVVGYGTQRKVNLTGAVQSIGSEDIMRRSVSNGSSALQGLVPGLTATQTSGAPGADNASLRIRGLGSLNSTQSPLILIDGVEGDMNRIDLNTIESISVLKDAASASIYGSRASNGVILITTKRGKSGKPKVTFNGYVGWNKPTDMPKPVNAVTYLQAIDQANINNNQEPQYTELIQKYIEEGSNEFGRWDTDWRSLIMKNSAMVQNYSIGVQGGGDWVSTYASAGYYHQDGMVHNNSFKRYTMRLNSDMKVTNWLKVGVDFSIRQAEVHNPIGSTTDNIGYAMTFTPILAAYDVDPETGERHWGYGLQGNNPVAAIYDGGYSNSIAPEYIAKANLTLTPVKGLTILGSWNWKRNDGRTNTFASNYDEYEVGIYKETRPAYKAARESRSSQDFIQYTATAQYENNFGKNYLKALVGFQSEELNYNSLEGYRNTFNYDGYEDLVHGDASTATNSTYRYSYAMLSYLFRVNYSFDNRYLFEVNGRYDGTSRFKKNKRWGFFPSVSAGWRISQEAFMESTRNVLDNLKLRLSYGQLGNQDIGSYFPYVSAISSAEGYGYWFDGNFVPGAAQVQLANTLIGWEKSSQFDVGLDYGLFSNRLSGSFDYYYRRVDDMLQQFPVPEFVALTAPWQNAGSMRNTGWEFSIEWNDRCGNVNYSARFNISDVRNKVLDLYGNEYTSGNRWTLEGQPYGQYYGYLADGLFQSQDEIDARNEDGTYVYAVYGERANIKPGYVRYVDINDDGVINGDDRVKIGDPLPHFTFGLNLSATWKNFDLSILFQGVGKNDVAYTGGGARPLLGNSTIYEHQLDTWTPENPNAKYPLLINDVSGSSQNNLFSSYWVKSAAFCRMKNLVIGYTIPQHLTRKATIERVRVYATAQNLFTIRGDNFYKGFDPETTSGASCYPLNKTFLVGLQLEF